MWWAFSEMLKMQLAKERLQKITGIYRERIFNQAGGEYWKSLFCWPTKLVEWNGKLGIVCPTYDKHFFLRMEDSKEKRKKANGLHPQN